jgi:glycosyltransferase involved in cell wall biosynthesis
MPKTAMLHFAVPPAVGGVEEVIRAHTGAFAELGAPVAIVTGVGSAEALPGVADFVKEPLLDTQHPEILAVTETLGQGRVPESFESLKNRIKNQLRDVLAAYPNLIVHNVLTVHVNFPATVALNELLDEKRVKRCIGWCHDFSWTMADYVDRLHPGHPWDLLKTHRDDVAYVVVSKRRRAELAGLFDCPDEAIRVIYNGVDTKTLLGLGEEGYELIDRLGVMTADLSILMPIRIVKSKNIEYALRVVSEIKAKGLKVNLVVTGPPDPHDRESLRYYAMLRDLRVELGLEENVRFVYESGPNPDEPHTISAGVVGDFCRACDLMLIASHSEGFGMPILEAGLAGKPVFTSDIPASREIGCENVSHFSVDDPPGALAARILKWAEESPLHRHRRKVRQQYTWKRIVERDLLPLLQD